MKKLINCKFKSIKRFILATRYSLLATLFLSVCIIFSICVYHSFADVPCKINYQGRLIKDNVPVNIPVDMVFELYESVAATTPIWDETHNNVPVHNGLFRVVLDLSSIEQEKWAAGQELWLEVEIDEETLSPREQIYAYPYAINSHLLEGSTKEYFINVSGEEQTKQGDLNIMGNVGIGTTSPGRPLDVNGVVKTQAALLDPVNLNNINNPVDGMIACDSNDNTIKQYDSSIADWKSVGGGFGDWLDVTSVASGGAVQDPVDTDGFVCAYNVGGHKPTVKGYTSDSSNPTLRVTNYSYSDGGNTGITMPVRKGHYWKVTGATKVYWIPLGN